MYIKVRVIPGGKKEKVTKVSETEFDIVVREKAERNMANNRIREILSSEYNIEMGAVRMITGHRSQSKIFDIEL